MERAQVPVGVGWTVLGLVFLDEVSAMVAAGVWGAHVGGPLLAGALPLVVMVVWWAFASPRAPYGGPVLQPVLQPVLRPVVKVLVFALATVALWQAGHPDWAAAFLAFSVVVNALAQLPEVAELPASQEA